MTRAHDHVHDGPEDPAGRTLTVARLLPEPGSGDDHDHGHDHGLGGDHGPDVGHGHHGPAAPGSETAQADPVSLKASGLGEMGVISVQSGPGRVLLVRVSGVGELAGSGVIRLSRYQMRALKVGAGETVSVTRADVQPARRLVLEPLAPLSRSIQAYEDEISDQLGGREQLAQTGMLIPVTLTDFRRDVYFRVISVTPDHSVVGESTRVVVRTSMLPPGATANLVTFDDVGGLRSEVDQIRELVECPLLYPHLYDQLGIVAPRGILLHGPPGVGKTHLARAIANEVGAHFLYVNGPEVLSSLQGGTEANLRAIFEEAMESAPSIVLIDELDSIAPARRDASHAEARMGTQLLSLLDGLVSMEDVVVIGTTNRPEALDPALRRPGRLDREILLGPPDADGRHAILRIHTRGMPLTDSAQAYLPELARNTHGYTGADLVDLVREAGLHALRRVVGPGLDRLNREAGTVDGCFVQEEDLRFAMGQTRPSALRAAMITRPGTSWAEVAGLDHAIQRLREAVEMPLRFPEAFSDIGLAPSTGVVLYGPPGTGKSMLANAVAQESGANLIAVHGPEIFSKWLGESEEAIRDAFQLARQSAPSVLVLDQLDAMAPRRARDSANPAAERVVNQLLVELDAIRTAGHIVVIAVTNRLDLVDPALLRPGRLGVTIEVGLPDRAAREQILRLRLGRHLDPPDENADLAVAVAAVADTAEGVPGGALAAICDDACLLALRDSSYARATRVRGTHLLAAAEDFFRRPAEAGTRDDSAQTTLTTR